MKKICILMALTLSFSVSANDKSDKACELFLKQIDAKKYGKTWDNSAKFFQNSIKKEQWVKSLDAVRTPLLKNLSRKKISKTPKSHLPGAPKGSYIIYQFQSNYSKKQSLSETITFVEEENKEWKLVGFYIR